MKKEEIVYIKCPICEAIYPEKTEFCICCGTLFDSEKIEKLKQDKQTERNRNS